jgi:Thiamine pyrophosphate enzyme, N-terminal TPP binding domain
MAAVAAVFCGSRVMLDNKKSDPFADMRTRARAVAEAGGLDQALARGLPKIVEVTLSEALVLGLLKQGLRKYFAIFGHGSTDLGNVLRVYEEEGLTRTINCRNEVEMAHAATALRWQYGELSAVVTSIGPGAMQAFAGSLAAASNGVGVYHIYGDETTFGEGYNMQQVPGAGPVCAYDGDHGPVLCAAYTGSVTRRFAARRPMRESSLSGRTLLLAAAAQYATVAADRQSRSIAGAAGTAETCAC